LQFIFTQLPLGNFVINLFDSTISKFGGNFGGNVTDINFQISLTDNAEPMIDRTAALINKPL